jgi:hypothetical protein
LQAAENSVPNSSLILAPQQLDSRIMILRKIIRA